MTVLRGSHRALWWSLGLCVALVSLSGCSVLRTWHAAGLEPCDARIDRGVLPEWARAGFGDAEPEAPHVVGRSGEIVAILFGDPLTAPPPADHNNKILWVGQRMERASDLVITAQRMEGTTAVGEAVGRSVAGGPGPSIIDLPVAGCWRLSLAWGGVSDTMDLSYSDAEPPSSP
jgi:hypothetical protein